MNIEDDIEALHDCFYSMLTEKFAQPVARGAEKHSNFFCWIAITS